jgi:hypothetical protein
MEKKGRWRKREDRESEKLEKEKMGKGKRVSVLFRKRKERGKEKS